MFVLQLHCPVPLSQMLFLLPLTLQLQRLQPNDVKPVYVSRQVSHLSPTTPGLQLQFPRIKSHWRLAEPVVLQPHDMQPVVEFHPQCKPTHSPHVLPIAFTGQTHCPVTALQTLLSPEQLQGVQPLEEKLKYPGRHLSHCLEVTPGLHRHCPSYLAQMLLIEPVKLQAHAKIELIHVFEHYKKEN